MFGQHGFNASLGCRAVQLDVGRKIVLGLTSLPPFGEVLARIGVDQKNLLPMNSVLAGNEDNDRRLPGEVNPSIGFG